MVKTTSAVPRRRKSVARHNVMLVSTLVFRPGVQA